MKNFALLSFCLLLLCHSAQTLAAGRGLTLATDGRTDCSIVLADDAIAAEKTAARQLQTYLQKVTGATFAIQSEGDAAADGPRILIGAGPRVRSLLPDVDWSALRHDGIVIRTVDHRLILAGGRPRGTLYAVFQFLEDAVGCRWWTSSEQTLPHRPTLKIPALNVVYAPPFDYREHSVTDVRNHPHFAAILRENGQHQTQLKADWGGHYEILGFVHTFAKLLPPKKYFKAHPEWYTDRFNGDLPCTSSSRMPQGNTWQLDLSNPQVLDELTRQALGWIERNPSAGYISISQNDNNHYCRGPRCAALAKAEGSQSAPILKFVNAVAERIHRHYPDFQVETLAYNYSIKPPQTLRPGPNVIIRVAPINADFGHPMESDWNRKDRDDFLAWAKISPRMFVWNYVTNFKYPMLSHPNWAGLGRDLRFYAAHHVTGIYQEGNRYTDGVGDFIQLRTWLLSKLMWNPSLDQNQLTDEFLQGYYGPAAPSLRQYLDLVQQSFLSQKRRLSDTNWSYSFFTADVAARAVHLFDRAAEAVQNDPVLASRVRRQRLALDGVLLKRAIIFRHQAGQSDRPPVKGMEALNPESILADFKQLAGEYKVQRFMGRPLEQAVARIGAELNAPDVPLPDFARSRPSAEVIDFQPLRLNLARPGKATWIVHDPHASGQSAAAVAGNTRSWVVQAPIGAYLTKPRSSWHLYVYVRMDVQPGTSPKGNGMEAGLLDDFHNRQIARFDFPIRQAAGDVYHRFDLGTHPMTPGTRLWLAPLDKPAVKKIYIDRILLIQEKDRS